MALDMAKKEKLLRTHQPLAEKIAAVNNDGSTTYKVNGKKKALKSSQEYPVHFALAFLRAHYPESLVCRH